MKQSIINVSLPQVQYNADWTAAQEICQTNEANLASIHSLEENNFIAGFVCLA
jgi:hypothetical protein